jgi:tripartite-type tricarboxylate transporter receptor subunit TctC
MDRPVLAPPGVPAERVEALRAAFHAAITDPDFLAEANKHRLEIEEVSGKEVAEIIRSSFTLPPDVIKAAAEASEVKGGSGG